MTPNQIDLVRRSIGRLAAVAPEAGQAFYARLFVLDPHLRQLFRTDIAVQGRKLMEMIAHAVADLDRPEEIVPVLRALGRRHRAYGVRSDDYRCFGEALIATLDACLGAEFPAETRAAWRAAFTFLETTMLDGVGQSVWAGRAPPAEVAASPPPA